MVVALTGVILFGFVIGHLLGNLQLFIGAKAMNDYAAFLKANPGLLWGTRAVLLLAIFLHIITTIKLVRQNRQSRPVPYRETTNIQGTWASRIMIWSGLMLAFYIVFHLLHLTVGNIHPDFSPTDVYGNVVKGLSKGFAATVYILGVAALGYHLYHGAWSLFQTLGLNHPKYNCWRRCFAVVSAIVIAIGYIAIPVSVLLGIVK